MADSESSSLSKDDPSSSSDSESESDSDSESDTKDDVAKGTASLTTSDNHDAVSGTRAAADGNSSTFNRGASSTPIHPQAAPSAAQATETTARDFHTIDELESIDILAYVEEQSGKLSFPEKLMLMLTHVEKEYAKSVKRDTEKPIRWVLDGQGFGIYDKEELGSRWLPMFFPRAKFSSFTRKLYRWGFRQIQIDGSVAMKYFANENFRRDDKSLLANMRSITAAGSRREAAAKDSEGVSKPISSYAAPVDDSSQVTSSRQPPNNETLTFGLQLSEGVTVPIALQVPQAGARSATIPQQQPPTIPPPDNTLSKLMMLLQNMSQPQSQVIAQAHPLLLQQALIAAQNLITHSFGLQPVQNLTNSQYILTLSRVESSEGGAPKVEHIAQSTVLPSTMPFSTHAQPPQSVIPISSAAEAPTAQIPQIPISITTGPQAPAVQNQAPPTDQAGRLKDLVDILLNHQQDRQT